MTLNPPAPFTEHFNCKSTQLSISQTLVQLIGKTQTHPHAAGEETGSKRASNLFKFPKTASGRTVADNPLFLVITARNPPGETLPDSLAEAKGGCLPQANPLAPRRVTAVCYLRSKSQFVMIIPISASNRSNAHGYVMQLWTIETQNRLSQRLHLLLELLSRSGWYLLQRLLTLWQPSCALRWFCLRNQHSLQWSRETERLAALRGPLTPTCYRK